MQTREQWLARYRAALPGLVLAFVVAVIATGLGRLAPVFGGPVLGIVVGAIVCAVHAPGPRFAPGVAMAGKGVLQVSVVLMGLGLSLPELVRIGRTTLPVMLGTLFIALVTAVWLGRLLRVGSAKTTLIGVGTAICGASAIAATTAVVDVDEDDVAYAVGTIFTFNVLAVLLYPSLGHAMGLSQHSFGVWAGTAINDTSSVVAASTTYGVIAANYAVVVKLGRALMIIPIVLGLAAWRSRTTKTITGRPSWRRLVPVFLIGFVIACAIGSSGWFPSDAEPVLRSVTVFLITMALAGIGLTVKLERIVRTGPRPLALGGLLWVLVGVSSLALQAATGTL
jgi:uncharacterized integral membrane protein (TIGR00698 family)